MAVLTRPFWPEVTMSHQPAIRQLPANSRPGGSGGLNLGTEDVTARYAAGFKDISDDQEAKVTPEFYVNTTVFLTRKDSTPGSVPDQPPAG